MPQRDADGTVWITAREILDDTECDTRPAWEALALLDLPVGLTGNSGLLEMENEINRVMREVGPQKRGFLRVVDGKVFLYVDFDLVQLYP